MALIRLTNLDPGGVGEMLVDTRHIQSVWTDTSDGKSLELRIQLAGARGMGHFHPVNPEGYNVEAESSSTARVLSDFQAFVDSVEQRQ